MDDTAEILERFDRIGALASAGAGRSDLLQEVRGLLEEGERRLRSEAPAEEEVLPRGAGNGARAGRRAALSSPPGRPEKETTVA